MTENSLNAYEDKLYGCRFCPMCKPAGEVANLTLLESHTTRARAMMLWRVVHGMLAWTPRAVELLYQSTLDSISEAWCVSHYPVSGYMLAARAEVYAAGLAPLAVRDALAANGGPGPVKKADVLLLAAEIAELGDETPVSAALRALQKAGLDAEPLVMRSGALAYSLGALDLAREQASAVADAIRQSGARRVVADGPQTLWALRRVYPALEVPLLEGLAVSSLVEHLAQALEQGALQVPDFGGKRVFVHDSRSSALLANALARAETIQPGFCGDEEALGSGGVYEAPRRLVDAMGMERLYTVWSRSLSRSCGADDGLWRTYPELAAGLARQRLDAAQRLGAELVVTDSPLSAAHLGGHAEGLAVRWLPQLISEGGL